MVLDRALLLVDASIRNFQQGRAGYIANAVEQALLLPEDMADLRSLRKYEVFLSLKRDLIMAVQATYVAEEIIISSHRMMKDEEGQHNADVKAFELAEKKSQELNAKLLKVDQDKKSAQAALDMAERQAEAQRKQLRQAEDDLSATRGQIKVLTKKLEEVKKAKEQAKQEGYDMGVIETEKAFRAEVTQVCRFYCLQVWKEALNQAGVEAFSALRKAENVYYTPTICTSGSLGFKADPVSSKADEGQASPSKAPPAPNTSPKEVERAEDIAKLGDINKEVVQGAALPLVAPKDPSKEKKAS